MKRRGKPARTHRLLQDASTAVFILVVVVTPAGFAMAITIVAIAMIVAIGPVIPLDDATGHARSKRCQEGAQNGETAQMAHAVNPMAVSMG